MKTHQLLAFLIENPLSITAEYANKISTELKCQKIPLSNEDFIKTRIGMTTKIGKN